MTDRQRFGLGMLLLGIWVVLTTDFINAQELPLLWHLFFSLGSWGFGFYFGWFIVSEK